MLGILVAETIPILQIRKQRHKVVELAQAYTTSIEAMIQTPVS